MSRNSRTTTTCPISGRFAGRAGDKPARRGDVPRPAIGALPPPFAQLQRGPTFAPATVVVGGASMAAKDELGAHGEELAARELVSLGWALLGRNWRPGPGSGGLRGEIDIVAQDGDELVV